MTLTMVDRLTSKRINAIFDFVQLLVIALVRAYRSFVCDSTGGQRCFGQVDLSLKKFSSGRMSRAYTMSTLLEIHKADSVAHRSGCLTHWQAVK